MSEVRASLIRSRKSRFVLCLMLGLTLLAPISAFADKKKKKVAEPKKIPVIDYSNIVWPNPPAIARIRFQAWYSAEKISQIETGTNTKKAKWMDRLAGTQPQGESGKVLWQLAEPYGMAVDSKNNLYVADQKVGAIFIFNTETRDLDMIKNKTHSHFVRIIGLAMDDNDRLFVSDPGLRHVLVFNAAHAPEDVITEGLVMPGSLAIDHENRLLYVSDVELDQVLVYDADTLKLKRKIGTTGHKHELTSPGDFAKPGGLAVDQEGNLYVADTLNDRIEIFDADGKFISTFGKNGDGPGYFARPKGVAIDGDGHIWVADGMQDRVQVFNQQAQLLIAFGGHGLLPGQFQALTSITIDKNNRVFTSEIFPGRVQQFRYVTDAEADQLNKERETQREKKVGASEKDAPPVAAPAPQTPTPQSH
ncbi:MAG TPA: SMP-30/gluconolactonase/LRE family protein [Terriglobales bacterium]|nr:SMP-30/gluconolactonase/LRE family protein [Terriglobales bacterium]